MQDDPGAFQMLPNNADLGSDLHSLLCLGRHLMSEFSKAPAIQNAKEHRVTSPDKQSEQLKGCLC